MQRVQFRLFRKHSNEIPLMKKNNLLYFLSFADSLRESCEIGHLERLKKEVEFLNRYYEVTIFSKDSRKFIPEFQILLNGRARICAMPYSIYGAQEGSSGFGLTRKLLAAAVYIQYQILTPLLFWNDFKKTDVVFSRHVSSGLAGIIARLFINRRISSITRLYWSWSKFNEKENSRIHAFLSRIIERFVLRRSDCVLVASEKLMRECRKKGVLSKRIVLLPNWIDTRIFSQNNNIKHAYDIIYIGRMAKEKNPLLLLEAGEKIFQDKGSAPSLLFIGKGPLINELLNRAKKYPGAFEHREMVSNEQIPNFLRLSNIYCITSHHEGCPKSLLEAMSCGLLCVGTDVAGIRDIIKHGINGLLAEENPASLAVMLLKAKIEERQNSIMRQNAAAFIRNNFAFESVMNGFLDSLNSYARE